MIDSKIWHFGSKIYDLIIINLLFMIFSIPIITIGPAIYAGIKTIEDLENYGQQSIFKLYLANFKDKFLFYSLSFNTFSGIFITGVFLLSKTISNYNIILNALIIFITIESLMCVWSLFRVKYSNITELIVNSFIYSNKYFMMILLNIIFIVMIFFITFNIPICMLIAFSLSIFFYTRCKY